MNIEICFFYYYVIDHLVVRIYLLVNFLLQNTIILNIKRLVGWFT